MSVENRIAEINNRLKVVGDTSSTIQSLTSPALIKMNYNPVPEFSKMLSKKITLYTKDITDPENSKLIDEPFEVIPGNFSPVKLNNSGGNRYILQFGSSGYGIKFHFPYGQSKNIIYLTFCEKDNIYIDGWKDYINNVSSTWISSAIAYLSKMPANTQSTSKTKTYSSSVFKKFNEYAFWATFRGIGPSTVSRKVQGTIHFNMQFVNKVPVVETGGNTKPLPINNVTDVNNTIVNAINNITQ
jgi:hypothetical protein